MKLSKAEAARHFANPDRSKAGTLIYGPDPLRVADRKDRLLLALIGPDGKPDLRLDDINPEQIRNDPSFLALAVKAMGLFSSGPRAVCIDNPGDSASAVIGSALDAHEEGDAWIIVTAGSLRPNSKLRKLFETHGNACAAAVYADAVSHTEVDSALRDAGIGNVTPDASRAIAALGQEMPPQLFRQLIEKISLYKQGDDRPVTCEEVEACAPETGQVLLDSLLSVVADRQPKMVGEKLRQLAAQGFNPVTICVAAKRTFKNIYSVASDQAGPVEGAKRLKPPAFGMRRDRLVRQARTWGVRGAELALLHLSETDRMIRSDKPAPPQAMVERTLLRIAHMKAN